jgi:hypothetical protein
MPVANRYYGGTSIGGGGTIQDFGLCDLKGIYTHTAKVRSKGLILVTFFSPESAASATILETVQSWATEIGLDKWTALALSDGDRDQLTAYADSHSLSSITVMVDYDLYQTRNWGISHLPSTFLVSGKTGQIIQRVNGCAPAELNSLKQALVSSVNTILAAEAAAKQAAEEAAAKKAADEAAAKK